MASNVHLNASFTTAKMSMITHFDYTTPTCLAYFVQCDANRIISISVYFGQGNKKGVFAS